MPVDPSTAAGALEMAKNVASAAWKPVRQEWARRGAQEANQAPIGSIDAQLDEAIDLLARHSTRAMLPWQSVKTWLSDPPEIFNVIAVREWINAPVVRAAIKRVVGAHIAGNNPDPKDEQTLVDVYVERTLNDVRQAGDAIAQTHNFLALSINRFLTVGEAAILAQTRQQTDAIRVDVAGIGSDINSGFAALHGRFDAIEKAQQLSQPLPTHYAEKELRAELDRVLKRRHFVDFDFSADINDLVARVTLGDLRSATSSLRIDPLRRAARLAASTKNVAQAKNLVVQCRQIDPSGSLIIEDAWISAASNDVPKALDALWNQRDPEHRAALLAIIRLYRSALEARTWLSDEKIAAADFSGNGSVLAVKLLLDGSEWDQAYAWTQSVPDAQRLEAPILEALCGIAATLVAVPVELRRTLLDQDLLPFFDLRSVAFHDDVAAQTALKNARSHFERAAVQARILGAERSAALYDDIALWLAFQDETSRAWAEAIVVQSVQDDALVFRRLRFALSYGIEFNRSAIEAEIARREKLDATTPDTVAADLILAVHSYRNAPQDLAAFIARKRNLLLRHFDRRSLACIEIEALAKAGFVGAARSALDEARALLDASLTLPRLEAVIAEASGADPVETRRATYEAGGRRLPDLYALIEAVRQREDWRELLPLAQELFRRELNLNAALLVHRCCRETRDENALSEFLLEIGPLALQSATLKSALAWDHYRHGRLKLARQVNDELRGTRTDTDDRNLAINIAIESGDWSALNVIVESSWDARAALSADELMSLARCAFEIGNARMLAFAELAVEKAPQDPTILLNAWLLANESGELASHPKAASWFATAVAHSGTDGPLKSVSMRELAEGMPGRRERNSRIAEGIYGASVPLFLAAEKLGVPLTQFIAGAAGDNAAETDGRRVVPIHAFHGSRGRVPLTTVKSLGLDLTAIVVLGYLGVLEATIKAFDRIVVPAGTLAQLFTDRQHIRFRQPASVEEAQRLQSLIGDESLLRMEKPAQADPQFIKEVGLELAELVATAQRDGGIVVAPAPIYKVTSFMEVLVDISSVAQLLTDTRAILAAPALAPILDATTREQAAAYLHHHDQGWASPAPLTDGKPLYLTDLAVTYLTIARVLPHLSRLGVPVYISREADEHAKALIKGNARLQPLLLLIEDIRRVLADGLHTDRIVTGPTALLNDTSDDIRYHPTMALERAMTEMDAVAIDDRAINQHAHWSDPQSGRQTPIVCTLDIIDHLHRSGGITQAELDRCHYRLRRDGFNSVPVLPDELHRLVETEVTLNKLIETGELYAVRESISRLVAFKSIKLPQERFTLQMLSVAAIVAIRRLWAKPGDLASVKVKANWLLDLLPDRYSIAALSSHADAHQQALADRATEVAHLAMPLFDAPDAMHEYARWVEEAVLKSLRRSEPEVLEFALARLAEFLGRTAGKGVES